MPDSRIRTLSAPRPRPVRAVRPEPARPWRAGPSCSHTEMVGANHPGLGHATPGAAVARQRGGGVKSPTTLRRRTGVEGMEGFFCMSGDFYLLGDPISGEVGQVQPATTHSDRVKPQQNPGLAGPWVDRQLHRPGN